MCGGNVGLGGLGAVGTGADAGTGGGIGAGASVAGLEICPPVSGGDPPAPFAGGKTCGEEEGNSSRKKISNKIYIKIQIGSELVRAEAQLNYVEIFYYNEHFDPFFLQQSK